MKEYLIEPVEIELDIKRGLLFTLRALMRAEREINRNRGAKVEDYVSIDYLIMSAAQKTVIKNGIMPLDLLITLLWASLLHEDPDLKIDQVPELIEKSLLERGKIIDAVWEAYTRAASKSKQEANGEDKDLPLAPTPNEVPVRSGPTPG